MEVDKRMQGALNEQLEELEKRNELEITSWMITEDEIMLFVREVNEENKKLEGQWINGREVRIAVLH